MEPIDRDQSSPDEARRFERLLLDSARADELPSNLDAAWSRFGASLAGAAELSRGTRGSVETGAPAATGGAAARSARLAALKWLLVGAIGGSALTAFAFRRAHEPRTAGSAPTAPTLTLAARGAASASTVASAGVEAATSSPIIALAPPPELRASVRPRAAKVGSPSSRRETTQADGALGAQVALLDTARAALAAGAYAKALAATDRFRRDFPSGELTPDAEVVAIETLAAQDEQAALAQRGARFLARYPSDPHAARVRALLRR